MNTIQELQTTLKKIQSAKEYILHLKEQIKSTDIRLQKAREQLRKENEDVEKLTHVSLTSLLAHFQNDKEERLAKEEQEAFYAAMQVKQLEADVASLNHELQRNEALIAQEETITIELENLQAAFFSSQQSSNAQKLKELKEQLDKNRVQDKELSEAIQAGDIVKSKLNDIQGRLDSAQSWGYLDVFGGGLISSLAKHNHIDHAQAQIAEIKMDVQRFHKELKDVDSFELTDMNISSSLTTFDIVFDNFISDFMVQSKIGATKENVRAFQEKVDKVLQDLHNRKKENEKAYDDSKKNYTDFLDIPHS